MKHTDMKDIKIEDIIEKMLKKSEEILRAGKAKKEEIILEQGQIDTYHNCMKGVSENYRKGII